MSSDPTALRVALRYALSAASRTVTASGDGYFAINDLCLFGKYKNKHGKIVAFHADKHGNPVVEIEPIPKGRKQNKVMGLYKIWHDPPPDQRGWKPGDPPANQTVRVATDPDDDHDFED